MIVKLRNAACYLCLALPRLHPRTTNRTSPVERGLGSSEHLLKLTTNQRSLILDLFKHCFDLGSGELVEPNGNKRLFNK